MRKCAHFKVQAALEFGHQNRKIGKNMLSTGRDNIWGGNKYEELNECGFR